MSINTLHKGDDDDEDDDNNNNNNIIRTGHLATHAPYKRFFPSATYSYLPCTGLHTLPTTGAKLF